MSVVEDDVLFEAEPCLGCPHRAMCSAGMSCAQFESFVTYGGRKWRQERRQPSAESFRRVFDVRKRGPRPKNKEVVNPFIVSFQEDCLSP
jgi:hypothetical protein